MRIATLSLLSLLLTGVGHAPDTPGIMVTVQVTDVAGAPIPTAVVRHPNEQERHPVNTESGRWEDSVLYMPDGSELFFEKGMDLEFEISAPGYKNERVIYTVRKRRNVIPVVLHKVEYEEEDEEEIDDPVIQFGRDKPID